MSPSILRLTKFEVAGAGFDAALRDRLAPVIGEVPGLHAVIGGRMGPGQDGPRLVATVWASREAMQAAIGAGSTLAIVDPSVMPGSAGGPADVLPIALQLDAPVDARIAIIRVVRGVTHPGELDGYLEDARSGVTADHSSGGGPIAFYLATDPPDRFVTVSLWGGWSHVEAATGADHEHVERTRHEERLLSWTAEHYEVVPGLAVIRPQD